ncbi:MAG: hypothetical protein QXQ36_01445 [Sulfolobales archaeon]
MRRSRKALSNIIAIVIGLMIMVVILIPMLEFYLGEVSRVTYSSSIYDSYIRYRDSENPVFEFEILDTPIFNLSNKGMIPIKIVRVLVLDSSGEIIPISLDIELGPGQSIDVAQLAYSISQIIGSDVTPDRIIAFVTARGNIVPIRNNIINLNIIRTIYVSEAPDFKPDRSLFYWNFSSVIAQGRIGGWYSKNSSSCSVSGSPYLGYLYVDGRRLYPTQILFINESQRSYVWFSFYNGTACLRYLFKSLLSLDPNVSTVRIYYRFIGYLNTSMYSTLSYDMYNVNISMQISGVEGIVGAGYQVVTIPLKGDSVYSLLLVSAFTGYIDVPVSSYNPNSKYDLIITLQITQNTGRIISSVIGLDYLVFQGAKPG